MKTKSLCPMRVAEAQCNWISVTLTYVPDALLESNQRSLDLTPYLRHQAKQSFSLPRSHQKGAWKRLALWTLSFLPSSISGTARSASYFLLKRTSWPWACMAPLATCAASAVSISHVLQSQGRLFFQPWRCTATLWHDITSVVLLCPIVLLLKGICLVTTVLNG